jgi:hypothetical protein
MIAEHVIDFDNFDVIDCAAFRTSRAASAPVMFEVARSWEYFPNALLTRICAQKPMSIGTMMRRI